VVAWAKEAPFGAEYADVVLSLGRIGATGVAIGSEPVPYRLDYTLETRRGFVTARLRITARGEGWRRKLDLRRSPSGVWGLDVSNEGATSLPPPGGDAVALAGALDCDLGLSPLTNTMPVLRHDLLFGGGPVDCVVAWVAVPELTVVPYRQRYTHLRREGAGATVRFEDLDNPFEAEIVFDGDGLVVDYPELAYRLR
jgi:hypothetical protein